jgi:hypothetical protein
MKRTLLFRALAITSVAIAILFATQTASADALTYTNGVSPYVVNSDAGTVYVTDITITDLTSSTNSKGNTTYYSVTLGSIAITELAPHNDNGGGVESNPNDVVNTAILFDDTTGNGMGNCYAGQTLAYGNSCTVELELTVSGAAPSKPTGEDSLTFGLNEIKLAVDSTESGGKAANVTADLSVQVDYTPEPSSLILLGTGLLGLAGVMRQRFIRS